MGVVNSEVVGEETQLEVGEGILPSQEGDLERAMGFEPTTSCLGSKHSTPELRPLTVTNCTILEDKYPFYFPIAPHTLQNNSVQIQYEQWLPLGGGFFYF